VVAHHQACRVFLERVAGEGAWVGELGSQFLAADPYVGPWPPPPPLGESVDGATRTIAVSCNQQSPLVEGCRSDADLKYELSATLNSQSMRGGGASSFVEF